MYTLPSALLAVLILTVPVALVSGKSVLEVIESIPDLSEFRRALTVAGLDSVLSGTSREFTIFAPSNAAIGNDTAFSTYLNSPGWSHHLSTNLQFMVAPGVKYTDNQVFDGQRTELKSLNGTLAISQPFSQVSLVSVKTPNNMASNGVIHVMSGVVKPDWRQISLRNVTSQAALQEELAPILNRLGFDQPLTEFNKSGTSWVAGRNRAYGNDSIAGGWNVIVKMITNPNNAAFQRQAYLYNLVDTNFYEQDIPIGFQRLVFPRNNDAHMWITKDRAKGILRFNDAELDYQALANNGITQIVTRPLIPPGIAMVTGYTGDYTDIDMKEMHQYFIASGWNLFNLTKSIGTGQGSLNMFVPLQGGFGDFNDKIAHRITTLEWQRHLWNFLLHMTVEPAMTTDEWHSTVKNAGGMMSVKMLSGFNTTFTIDDQDILRIDGAEFLQPYDLKGIDGYLHIVQRVPLPPSVLYSVYDQTKTNPLMTVTTRLIDVIKLGPYMDQELPLTFFSPIDSAWNRVVPTLDIENVLKNMIFTADTSLTGAKRLLFTDSFLGMDGQTITSVNGKVWKIQVIEDPSLPPMQYAPDVTPIRAYFSNTDGPAGLTNCSWIPGPNTTNILALNGVIHEVDCLFLGQGQDFPMVAANAPTFAPIPAGTPGPTSYAVITPTPLSPSNPPVPSPFGLPPGAPGASGAMESRLCLAAFFVACATSVLTALSM